MSDYKLWIVSQGWQRLSPKELEPWIHELANLGLNFTVERVDKPRPTPEVVVEEVLREVVKERYVCATCGYESTKRGVRTHQAMMHKTRLHKVEVTP